MQYLVFWSGFERQSETDGATWLYPPVNIKDVKGTGRPVVKGEYQRTRETQEERRVVDNGKYTHSGMQ